MQLINVLYIVHRRYISKRTLPAQKGFAAGHLIILFCSVINFQLSREISYSPEILDYVFHKVRVGSENRIQVNKRKVLDLRAQVKYFLFLFYSWNTRIIEKQSNSH